MKLVRGVIDLITLLCDLPMKNSPRGGYGKSVQ